MAVDNAELAAAQVSASPQAARAGAADAHPLPLWEGGAAGADLDLLAAEGLPGSASTSGDSAAPLGKGVRFGPEPAQPGVERRRSLPRVPTPHPREFAALVLESEAADAEPAQ